MPATLNIALLLEDCYFRRGELKKAVAPIWPEPYACGSAVRLQMALGQTGTGNLEHAKKMQEEIVKGAPNFPDAHIFLARV